MKSIKKSFVILFLLCAVYARADVKPASPFGDHMVLQRNMQVPIWGTANAGEKVTVTFNKQTKTATADAAGNWRVNLDKFAAGGPYTLTLTGKNTVTLNDVYAGEVWICSGQSNMDFTLAKEDRYWCGVFNEAEEVAAASYPTIRVFDTDFTPSKEVQPAVKSVAGWEIVSPKTVGHMSALAYFFARNIQKELNVPVGMITTAFGASTAEAWIRKEALEANPKFAGLLTNFRKKLDSYGSPATAEKFKNDMAAWQVEADKAKAENKTPPRAPRNPDPVRDQHNPYVLWNGMVAPLVPYAIKGALWYQGESNSPSASIFREINEALITDWRKQWNQGDFPFIYVQLANIQKAAVGKTNFDPDPAHGGEEAIKREAQLLNLSVPKTAMVVAIDNADPEDMVNVHPKNKQEIGRRLSLAGMAIAYGKKVSYSGPLFDKMQVNGNSVKLDFKNTDGGLVAKSGKLTGFAIAGEDKKFVWADAKIVGNSVMVSSPDVSKPVAVRYGWGNNPPTSLYNTEQNLPASPFRTDKD